jgi:hypothetical protein
VVLTDFPLAFQDLRNLQEQDQGLGGNIDQIRRDEIVGEYSLTRNILYFRNSKRGEPKIVVPPVAIPMVFAYFHQSLLGGHLGVYKTIRNIRAQFMLKGMDRDIQDRVRAYHLSFPT